MQSDITQSGLIDDVRSRFAHIDECPLSGKRIFFENAGGALTLKSVVETSTKFAAIPDNQGRDNPASKKLVEIIDKARSDAKLFFGVDSGQIFLGESGTELLFRIISFASMSCESDGNIVGTSLEHPATRSAARQWSDRVNLPYREVAHNNDTGTVDVSDYESHIDEKTRLATIIHTSPVTGMSVDIAKIAKMIRARSPNCYIIVDGIQHAAHGGITIGSYDIDAYVISPYKVFSRHGYGLAWISDRLTTIPHNNLTGGPSDKWELGTRDTGSYATFSDVVDYFLWLGGHYADKSDKPACIEAAGIAISTQEKLLTDSMLQGVDNLLGLADIPEVEIIGGIDNPHREGLVAMNIKGLESGALVERLNDLGIRVHIRKDDYYSSNVLAPLGLPSCVRVSLCHYNSVDEVRDFLIAIRDIVSSLK